MHVLFLSVLVVSGCERSLKIRDGVSRGEFAWFGRCSVKASDAESVALIALKMNSEGECYGFVQANA